VQWQGCWPFFLENNLDNYNEVIYNLIEVENRFQFR
jgi:hypothetical protein